MVLKCPNCGYELEDDEDVEDAPFTWMPISLEDMRRMHEEAVTKLILPKSLPS